MNKEKRSQLRCIYKITNPINGKFYIGSTTEYDRRYKEHYNLLRNNIHYNINLQSDYNEYGEVFTFEVIEVVGNKEQLIEREQYYLDTLRPDYNILIIADSPLGVKRRDETKEKMRLANLGLKHPEWRNKIKSEAQRGEKHWTKHKSFTQESKNKMSESRRKLFQSGYVHPLTGKKTPEGVKDKIRNALSISVLQLDAEYNVIKEWSSMTEAAKTLGLDKSCISLCTKGKRKSHGGFLWKVKK